MLSHYNCHWHEGGSEGSQWFSYTCSTSVTRVSFVAAIVAAVTDYGLAGTWLHRPFSLGICFSYLSLLFEGVNIDWVGAPVSFSEHLSRCNFSQEFPNMKGNGNPYMPEDTANLLSLLVILRSALGGNATNRVLENAVNSPLSRLFEDTLSGRRPFSVARSQWFPVKRRIKIRGTTKFCQHHV